MARWLALLFVGTVYAVVGLGRPSDVFWSPDQAGRMLQVLALLDGRLDLSIEYPGRWLDPDLEFRPYVNSYVHRGEIHFPWPVISAAAAALLYTALGQPGLIIPSLAGGVLAAWAAGHLAEKVEPGPGWLATMLAGLATPLFVYSTLFWDHAPAAGLFAAAVVLATGDSRSRPAQFVLAGCCWGLALALRNEITIFLLAFGAAWLRVLGVPTARALARLTTGAALVLVPVGAYNLLTTGALQARTNGLVAEPGLVVQNLARYGPWIAPELAAGRNEFGFDLPDPLRWAPVVGIVVLIIATQPGVPCRRLLRLVGLALSGLATAAVLTGQSPGAVHGFLIAAPYLTLTLVALPVGPASPTVRLLALFAVVALPMYALAAVGLHVRGLAGGGAEWGPRFALPLYPLLATLAALALRQVWRSRQYLEGTLGGLLVALAVLFQLGGLAQIDAVLPELRELSGFVHRLPEGIVVSAVNLPLRQAPTVTRQRSIFCAETPAALKRWSEKAAGVAQFWYVDRGSLPLAWRAEGLAPPESLAEIRGGRLRAALYEPETVGRVLRREGPDRDTCGFRLLD